MPPATVLLRPALDEDCQRVFDWANDPVTRSASFHSAVIAYEDHQRWYADSLRGDQRYLRVAEADDVATGTLDLELRQGR